MPPAKPDSGGRDSKRRKAGDGGPGSAPPGKYPGAGGPSGYPGQHIPPHHGYGQAAAPHYGSPPPGQYPMQHPHHGGQMYGGWPQSGQGPYGGGQPHWQQQPGPPPGGPPGPGGHPGQMGIFRQQPGPPASAPQPKGMQTPDRGGWGGYGGPPSQAGSPQDGMGSKSVSPKSRNKGHKVGPGPVVDGIPPGPASPTHQPKGSPGQYGQWGHHPAQGGHGPPGGWSTGHPGGPSPPGWAGPGGQQGPGPHMWSQHPHPHAQGPQGGGLPPSHHGGPPGPQPSPPPPGAGPQKMWGGGGGGGPMGRGPTPGHPGLASGMASPARGATPSKLRQSPMDGSMGGPDMLLCKPLGADSPGGLMMMSPGQMSHDGDGKMKGGGGGDSNSKDKGRGSYRCGKCGVPKKGHVCPYQPKLKRRPDEPPPEMRNASTQVEMDEFLVLRRLNIEIQGFPESYAVEPNGLEDMVGAESHPPTPAHAGRGRQTPMAVSGSGGLRHEQQGGGAGGVAPMSSASPAHAGAGRPLPQSLPPSLSPAAHASPIMGPGPSGPDGIMGDMVGGPGGSSRPSSVGADGK